MQNNFNKMDLVFKEAANGHELPFNEQAWILMNQKLDSELGNNLSKNKSKKRLFFWLGLVAMAMVTATVVLVNNGNKSTLINSENIASDDNKKPNQDNNSIINETNSNTNTLAKNDNKLDNVKGNLNSNKNILSLDNQYKTNIVANKKEKEKYPDIQSNPNQNFVNTIEYNKNKKSNNKLKTSAVDLSKNNIESVNINKSNTSENKSIIPNNSSNSTKNNNIQTSNLSSSTNNVINSINNTSIVNYVKPNFLTHQMHNKYIEEFEAAEAVAAKIPKPDLSEYYYKPVALMSVPVSIPFENKFYFSLSAGSNISFIKYPQLNDMRLGANAYLGFNLSNQLSFQIGLGYSNRSFWAETNQFRYSGTVFLGEKIREGAYVDASVLRIPIEIRYQFNEKPNTGLFFTTGFSKLIYLHDNTSLRLKNIANNTEYMDLNYTNKHSTFNMFNLSLGYQFPITKHYTFTLQQLLELPLDNFGSAATRMSSTGTQLGIKYSF